MVVIIDSAVKKDSQLASLQNAHHISVAIKRLFIEKTIHLSPDQR
jgi:hypothetical protein